MINLSRRYLIIFGIVLLLVAVALCVTMLLGFAVGQETRRTAEELAKTAQRLEGALANVLFVKPGASGNCKKWWDNACDLATALDQAMAGDEIWVAKGTYKPTHKTEPGDPRSATFVLKSRVALYGGFAGGETSRDQRKWQGNVTILSGDIDDNDIKDTNHVITRTANITGTNSLHVVTSSGTHTAVLDGFTITGGNAGGNAGGSRYYPTNTLGCGGGMFSVGRSPTLVHVTFVGNKADAWGGGMFSYRGQPTLVDVTFDSNTAESGGGMSSRGGQPELVNVVFLKNRATINGGGLHTWESSQPTLTNVTFYSNTAASGGGIYNGDKSSLELTNCILWGNVAGGKIDQSAQISSTSNSTITVTYSLVQGWKDNTTNHVYGARDPRFETDGVRLQPGSPAINAGNNDSLRLVGVETDPDGNPRIVCGTVDMGAYEYQFPEGCPTK